MGKVELPYRRRGYLLIGEAYVTLRIQANQIATCELYFDGIIGIENQNRVEPTATAHGFVTIINPLFSPQST